MQMEGMASYVLFVELPMDAQQHEQFALLLRSVLAELSISTEHVKYTCVGMLTLDGALQGYVAVRLEYPGNEKVKEF